MEGDRSYALLYVKDGIRVSIKEHSACSRINLDFFIISDTVKSGWSINLSQVVISKNKFFFSGLTNNGDLMKCRIMRHFIWVFTVCQSIRLRGSDLKRVNTTIMLFNISLKCSALSFLPIVCIKPSEIYNTERV